MRRKKRRYADADRAYMRSLSSAVVQRSPRYLIFILLVMALVLSAGVAWMSYAELDVVVRGSGKVIPSQQLQVMQSLEGGVVSEILVKEGDVVEMDQPLIKISDIAFASSLEENRVHSLELRARIIRLTAEADDAPFTPDQEMIVQAPELLRAQRSLFDSNRQQLAETLRILEEDLGQARNEITEAQAKERQINRSLALLGKELTLKAPLVKKRLVSEVEYLQLQRSHNDLRGELESLKLSVPRIESTIEQGKGRLEQTRLDFRNKAKRELNEAKAEAARIGESQEALRDRVRRTTLRSPMKGTVTRLHINTIGGVIPPGGQIMEIVPFEGALLIEVRINPSDIADITTGLPARLKFSAYDFAIFGSLKADVRFLSADTITSDKGESYYVARLKPAQPYLGPRNRPLPIRVGMTVEADIITSKKTVLQYLFKPITRGLHNALRES